jgi:hypothetical protein
MLPAPRRRLWTLPLITLLLTALTACSSSSVAPKADATRSGAPQATTLGVTTVQLPANGAPTGTKLTLAKGTNPLPLTAQDVVKSLTPPVQISLAGAQPLRPAMVIAHLDTAPVDLSKVYLVVQSTSNSPVQLIPATWDPARHTLSAPMSHFSVAFFGSIDIGKILDQITIAFKSTFSLGSPRPECAGKPVTRNGTTYTLPSVYTNKGDGVVWPCLGIAGDKISLELQSNTGLPYRVRVSPKAEVTYGGTLDIGAAAVLAGYQTLVTKAPYSESLLIPSSSVTYRFTPADLPGVVQAKIDVGSHLALTSVWAVQYLLTIFHIDVKLLDQADVIKCVGDAVDTAGLSGTQPSAAAMGSLMKSAISCTGPIVKAAGGVLGEVAAGVLSVLGGGVGLVVAGLQGAIRTATGTDLTTLKIETAQAASLTSSAFVGDWYVHGGSLTIHSDGTALTSVRLYESCTRDGITECYGQWSLTTHLSPDGKTATLTSTGFRYVASFGGPPQQVTDLHWKSGAPAWIKTGIVLRYQFIAPGIIKDLNGAIGDGSQPYMCSAKNPPTTNLCGA